MKMGRGSCMLLIVAIMMSLSCLLVMDQNPLAASRSREAESSTAWGVVSHQISIQLDLQKHFLKATDTLMVRPGRGELNLLINSSLKVDSICGDPGSRPLPFRLLRDYDLLKFFPSTSEEARESYRNASLISITIPQKILKKGEPFPLTVSYEGEIYDPPKRAEFSRENIADQTSGLIGEEGVYLSEASHWYPSIPGALPAFHLEVTAPSAYEIIAEGDLAGRAVEGDRARTIWDVPYPTEALHLVAGKYVVTRSPCNDIEVSTYFFPEEQGLSEQYISAVKKYLKMYEEMIGKYPYKKFAVVENFFPTGYGMPSFTLLGREVIKLPFIVSTSLGHEVAHNWWGNSVFVDFETGNWCEGLTTYLADYHYKEFESEKAAEQYRREICRDYTNYVTQSGQDLPLVSFRERTTPATRAIGYGKTLMVFHMLRNMVGAGLFYETLRDFYKRNIWRSASWKDIEAIFEEKSGKELSWFFRQWVEREGAPVLRMKDLSYQEKGGKYVLTFEAIQEAGSFALTVPVEVETKNGTRMLPVEFPAPVPSIAPPGKEKQDSPVPSITPSGNGERESQRTSAGQVMIELDSPPLSVNLDPHQDIFRKLYPEEVPPILSGVFGDKDHLIVLLPGEEEALQAAYAEMAASLSRTGEAAVVRLEDLTDEALREKSILILGNISRVERLKEMMASLPGIFSLSGDSFTLNGKKYGRDSSVLFTIRNPWDGGKVVALFAGFEADAVKASGRKLTHYGKYSYLAFTSGENKDKGILPITSSPLIHRWASSD